MGSIWSQSFPAVSFQYETLAIFDTSKNKTTVSAVNPALYWNGGVLPDDQPENSDGKLRQGGESIEGIEHLFCCLFF